MGQLLLFSFEVNLYSILQRMKSILYSIQITLAILWINHGQVLTNRIRINYRDRLAIPAIIASEKKAKKSA